MEAPQVAEIAVFHLTCFHCTRANPSSKFLLCGVGGSVMHALNSRCGMGTIRILRRRVRRAAERAVIQTGPLRLRRANGVSRTQVQTICLLPKPRKAGQTPPAVPSKLYLRPSFSKSPVSANIMNESEGECQGCSKLRLLPSLIMVPAGRPF
jgi:hypothetical protein